MSTYIKKNKTNVINYSESLRAKILIEVARFSPWIFYNMSENRMMQLENIIDETIRHAMKENK